MAEISKPYSAPKGHMTISNSRREFLAFPFWGRGTNTRRKCPRLFAWHSLVVVDEVPLKKTAPLFLMSAKRYYAYIKSHTPT